MTLTENDNLVDRETLLFEILRIIKKKKKQQLLRLKVILTDANGNKTAIKVNIHRNDDTIAVTSIRR